MHQSRHRYRGDSSRFSRTERRSKRGLFLPLGFFVLVIAVIGIVGYHFASASSNKPKTVATVAVVKPKTATPTPTVSTPTAAATVAAPSSQCASNTLDQNIVVSISQRHLWACTNTAVSYDSPVVTGMENLPADLTPVGTYHIYAKETNQTLTGSDSTGSWSDPVSYWMPWLDNQYGAYGFHDATWRAPGDFGNISPYSSNASHGCVELPLATAKWLYGWASVGTTVTIES